VQELRTQGQVNEQVEAQAKQIVDSALVLLWKWMSDADNNVYVDSSQCERPPCDTYILFVYGQRFGGARLRAGISQQGESSTRISLRFLQGRVLIPIVPGVCS
jgi:hypothetical protein